jgi:elongation factor P hydroxylase
MTDDLVKRLREVKDWWREPGRTAEQAADRIEQLETALQAMLHAVCSPTGFAAAVRTDSGKSYPWVTLEYAEKIARAALGEKKDV